MSGAHLLAAAKRRNASAGADGPNGARRGVPQRAVLTVRSPASVAHLQHAAGNHAAALFLQRYELREYQDHEPPAPYTTIHFRFDDTALPAHPHEHVHITIQDDNVTSRAKVHFYYNSWTRTWRRTGPGIAIGSLAAIQQAAIAWAEGCAKKYDMAFYPPPPVPAAEPLDLSTGFPALGSPSRAQLEKAAAARARQEKAAELKRRKAAEAKAEADRRRAERQQKREAKELLLREQEASIASLSLLFELAFDLSPAVAAARARALVQSHVQAPPMSEAAMSMYG